MKIKLKVIDGELKPVVGHGKNKKVCDSVEEAWTESINLWTGRKRKTAAVKRVCAVMALYVLSAIEMIPGFCKRHKLFLGGQILCFAVLLITIGMIGVDQSYRAAIVMVVLYWVYTIISFVLFERNRRFERLIDKTAESEDWLFDAENL